jgi:hypothetical protein
VNGVVTHKRFDFTNELPEQLAMFGLNRSEQLLAVPYMWFTPGGSDPDSAGAQAVVLGAKNALRALGLPIKPTGYVDRATVDGLCQVAGRNWKSQPWTHIYRSLRGAIISGVKLTPGPGPQAGNVYALGDVPMSSIKISPRGTASGGNAATTELFRELQRQINRLAHVTKGFGKLKVDGLIGKNTVAAAVAAENAAGQSVFQTHTVEAVARRADVATDAFRQAANQIGAPAKVAGSTSSSHAGGGSGAVRQDPTREGGLTTAPNSTFDSLLSQLQSPLGLAAVGVGAFGLFFMLDKGRGRKKTKRRRRRRR